MSTESPFHCPDVERSPHLRPEGSPRTSYEEPTVGEWAAFQMFLDLYMDWYKSHDTIISQLHLPTYLEGIFNKVMIARMEGGYREGFHIRDYDGVLMGLKVTWDAPRFKLE